MSIKIVNYSTAPRLSTVDIYGNTNLIIANVATLRTTEPSYSGQVITLTGHTTAGVGGGNFRYDASDTTTADDDGIVIVTTSGSKRWKRILSDHVHSDMYNGNVKKVIENANTKYAIKLLSDYSVTSTINLRSNTTIEGNGFSLEPASAIGVLDAQGSLSGSWTNLTSNMTAYTSTLVTTLSLTVGDWVFVRSEATYSDPADGTAEDPAPTSKYGQIFKITHKSGDTYRTDCVSQWNFNTSDTAQIRKITALENLDIRNVKINKDNYSNQFTIGFRNQYVVNSIIENPIFIGSKTKYSTDISGRTALKFIDCVNVLVSNPKFYHVGWYGVELLGACRNVNIENFYGHDCRHTTSFNWNDGYGKPIDCHITQGVSDTSTLSGIDTHPNSTQNCTINNILSRGSVGDSGFQIRSSGVVVNNCEGNDNYLDGMVGRGIGSAVQVNNFTAKRNLRNGVYFQDYGVNLTNPIIENNGSAGVYTTSGIISGGRIERNIYGIRILNNASDTNKLIVDGVYAPFSTGVQTVGIFIASGYDAQKLILNNNDFTGYGDFVLSVPTGQGTSYIPQWNGNNKLNDSITGGLLYGVATFASAGSQTISTTSFRNLTAPSTTRGVLVSNVRLTLLSGSTGVTVSYRPVTDKISFEITASGACTVAWRILGV